MLAMLIDDKDLRDEVSAYNLAADRFNKRIREGLKGAAKDVKAPSKATIEKGINNLSKKLTAINEKVEDLCTVRPTNAITTPPPALKGFRRAGMAGSSPKKRPIYPRYFVASMGRSRR
jgi:hypothetical protein